MHDAGQLPRISEVSSSETTVITRALINWAAKKKILTMRQWQDQQCIDIPDEPMSTRPSDSSNNAVLEIPYCPKHENPSFEVLQEISKEVWDQIEKGDQPPKQLIIHGLIKEKYKQRTGVEPPANEIKRIDAIARPPAFKNQGNKENG
jgi:hypothetical protein